MDFVLDFYRKILFKVENLDRQNLFARLKSTGLFLLVPIIGFITTALTSPIFAKYLTAEEFGYYGYYSSLLNIVGFFYGLQFQTYFMSVYFREKEEQRKVTLTSLILFNIVWNLFYFPVSYLCVYLYFNYTNSQIPFYPFAILTFIATVISTYKNFVQVDYRLQKRPFKYFLFVTGHRLLTIFVSLYFVVQVELGLTGRLIGILIAEGFFCIVSFLYIFKGQKINIDKEIIIKAFKVVLPLFPAAFLYLPILSYDNIVLERMNDPAEMGLYNIGRGAAGFLYTALFPFYQTFEPDIYKNAVSKSFKELKRLTIFLILMVIVALAGFWMFSSLIIDYLTAGKYIAATKYANILVITSGLMIIFSIFDAIINALQKTKKSLIVNAITSGLCIIIYTLGGIYFKQIGVAIASVTTYAVLILLQVIFVISKLKKL